VWLSAHNTHDLLVPISALRYFFLISTSPTIFPSDCHSFLCLTFSTSVAHGTKNGLRCKSLAPFLATNGGERRVERVRFFFLHFFRLYGHDRLTYGQTVWGLFFCEFAPDPQDWDRNTPKVTTEREDRSRWANKLTIIKANNIQAFARGGRNTLFSFK
jgi:hypothetical protein